MNQRWKMRNTTSNGSTNITPKAKICPQSVGGWPRNTEISSGSGRNAGWSTIITGQRNAPQEDRNVRMVTDANTGLDIGTTM